MGDGRYYSYEQFFDILILMLLTTFVAGSWVCCHYRGNKEDKWVAIHRPLLLIFFFCLMRIIETVIPNMTGQILLRNIESGLILLVVLIIAMDENFLTRHLVKGTVLFFSLLVTIGVGRLFVDNYVFHQVIYRPIYVWALGACLLACLIFSRKRSLKVIKFLALVLPTSAYLVLLIAKVPSIGYYELALMSLYTLYINRLYRYRDESSMTMLAFDKIGDATTNFIFVTDENNKLVYKNEAAAQSSFFKENLTINPSDFTTMFNGEKVEKPANLGEDYMVIKTNGKKNYFTYKERYLTNHQKHIGTIITIANMTELIELLMDLESKREESRNLNNRLNKYSKVVYHIEKGREVNHLLEEIMALRDRQMKDISDLIKEAEGNLYDLEFEDLIDHAIKRTHRVLEEVRETVTEYRDYEYN